MKKLNKAISFIKKANEHHLKKWYDRKNINSYEDFMDIWKRRECRYKNKCIIDEDKKSLCRKCSEILKQKNVMKMVGFLFKKFEIEHERNQNGSSIYLPAKSGERLAQIRISDHWAPVMTLNPPTNWAKKEILLFLKLVRNWKQMIDKEGYNE